MGCWAHWQRVILCLSVLGAMPVAGKEASRQPRLILATEENPPANFTHERTGQLTGLAVEKMRAIMALTGIPYELRMMPWADAYQLAQTDPRACVFLTNRTADREASFQWVGPLMEGGWALFARPDFARPVERPEDLAGLRVAVQGGGAMEALVREWAAQVPGLQPVIRAEAGDVRVLRDGEADILAAGLWAAPYYARKLDQPVRMVLRLTRSVGALACHPAMPTPLIAQMQDTLNLLGRDGYLEEIDARYRAPGGWARWQGDAVTTR